MTSTHVNEELLHIRKRARRRLVGAVALVLFALAVLWTVLDNVPPPQFAAGHSVEITSSAPALQATASVVAIVQVASAPDNASAVDFNTLPPTPPAPVLAVAPESQAAVPDGNAESVLPGKLVNKQTAVKVDEAVVTKPKTEKKPDTPPAPDPRKILEGKDEPRTATATAKYYLQVGAFSDAAKSAQLLAKLKSAGLPAYSEKVKTSKGELTRIRVGPSTSETRAQEWRKKSEALGVPGKVIKQ